MSNSKKTVWLFISDSDKPIGVDLATIIKEEIEYGEINPRFLKTLPMLIDKDQLKVGDLVYDVSCGAYNLYEVKE